jgi:1-acyl-sn-glycerol-3-phosphate acyltransferase
MEKFRHFGDAASGIHPFTVVISPTPLGRVGAVCMFPIRLLFSTVFVLLLLITDTLLWVLCSVYLGLLGRLLIAPLQRAWIRGLLFFIGHILPDAPPIMTQSGSNRNNSSAAADNAVTSRQVRGGDLVVCNLQSVWDGLVLEVMLAQPYHVVCFPDATVTECTTAPGLRVFWPSPLQRWRVWRFVRRTGRLDFLNAQQPSSTAQQAMAKKAEELPLHRVQDAAAKAGAPVWWFGEGTCSNGKGLLPMPAVVCRAASSLPSCGTATTRVAECGVYLATIQYNSPALQNVLGSDIEGFFSALFRTSVLLYGSTAPAWSSPFFPSAEVTFRPTRLSRAAAEIEANTAKSLSSTNNNTNTDGRKQTHWTLSTPALLELRNAMCQRGQALVASGGAVVRRQPLSVGVKEKKGFVEAYVAMLQKP